jgi:hypothetical protein
MCCLQCAYCIAEHTDRVALLPVAGYRRAWNRPSDLERNLLLIRTQSTLDRACVQKSRLWRRRGCGCCGTSVRGRRGRNERVPTLAHAIRGHSERVDACGARRWGLNGLRGVFGGAAELLRMLELRVLMV